MNMITDVTIREARPEDAEQLISHVQRLAQEPGVNIGLAPGEFSLTVEEQESSKATGREPSTGTANILTT